MTKAVRIFSPLRQARKASDRSPALENLAPAIEALAALAGPEATDGGSNNWAVAPSRTATGRPLLAGDPHRAFEMPSRYSHFHLAWDAFDAIGLSLPGVPGFPHLA